MLQLPRYDMFEWMDRDEVVEARSLSPDVKLRLGAQLFDMACEICVAGIRNQHPELDEAGVLRTLRERIALGARLEQLN